MIDAVEILLQKKLSAEMRQTSPKIKTYQLLIGSKAEPAGNYNTDSKKYQMPNCLKNNLTIETDVASQ
jgi:hypothetical protein